MNALRECTDGRHRVNTMRERTEGTQKGNTQSKLTEGIHRVNTLTHRANTQSEHTEQTHGVNALRESTEQPTLHNHNHSTARDLLGPKMLTQPPHCASPHCLPNPSTPLYSKSHGAHRD